MAQKKSSLNVVALESLISELPWKVSFQRIVI